MYSFCKKCNCFFSTNYNFKHVCGENFCRICFSRHNKNLKYCNFSRSSLREVEHNHLPSHVFFADLHVSGNTKEHALFLADIELSSFTELHGLVICQNLIFKFNDFKSDSMQFDMFDSDSTLKVAIQHLAMQASANGPILVLCKLDLYDNFKKVLNREKRTLKCFKNCFKFGKICFKIFQNFVDFNDIQLAHLLGKNPNFAVIPNDMSFTDHSVYDFKQGDFPTEELVFGDNISLLEGIEKGKLHLKQMFDGKPKNYIYQYLIFFKTLNAVTSLKKLSHAFNLILPTSYSKTEKNVFAFNTLVESGFSLYTESLKDANVCILPNQVAAKHTNSSKAELIMSSLFDKVHSTICSSRTFSFTNHDGNQFHVGKLSIDWFCPTCKIGVMIEGSQKTLCLFHPKKVKAFFGHSNKDLFLQSQLNRVKLIQQSKFKVHRIFILNECCCHQESPILQHILKQIGPRHFKAKEIRLSFKQLMTDFNLTKFQMPDFQNAILSNMVGASCLYVRHNTSYQTVRFDMENAHLKSLLNTPVPKGPPLSLIGEAANNFFHTRILPENLFSVLSLTILPPQNSVSYLCLPFFALKGKNGVQLTLCKSCAAHKIVSQHCNHTNKEREFNVTCLLSDLKYAMGIGYQLVCVNSLHYWPICENVKELDDVLSAFIYSMQYNKSDALVRKFLKKMALQGLGRFAYNLDNKSKETVCFQSCHFNMELTKDQNTHFEVNENFAVFNSKSENLNSIQKYKQAVSAQLNPLLFATASNNTRIRCHQKALQCIHFNTLLCRIDTDCITCTFPRSFFHIVFFIFKESFKIEEDDLVEYISLKPRHYQYLRSNGSVCIKSNGLKLSLSKRQKISLLSKINEISLKDRICPVEYKQDNIHYIQSFSLGS